MNSKARTIALSAGAATLMAVAGVSAAPNEHSSALGAVAAQATTVATTTAVATAVGGSSPTAVPTISISSSVYQAGGEGSFLFANAAFQRVWDRTDHPVKLQQTTRTWFWGPGPNTGGLTEQYNDSPLGNKARLVQYFDKSRMELNDPNADPTKPFYVTNGLLTVELISGAIQVGERDFTQYHPACTPMTGDFGDSLAPTYFAFQKVSNTQAGDHPAANRTGQKVVETIDRNGVTGTDPSKASVPGVQLNYFENTTKHNIPVVFWDFLNSSGVIHNDQHQPVTQQLITPWYFASGLPISEPYWAKARIAGTVKDVMVQAYERRVLTYVPTNSAGFQVEMGNIGQHYFDWRYRNAGLCPGIVQGTPTPPVSAPTGTPGATHTAVAGTPTPGGTQTPRPTPCPGCPTATPTATIDIPPGPIVTPMPHTATPAAGTPTSTRTAVPVPTR